MADKSEPVRKMELDNKTGVDKNLNMLDFAHRC